MPRRPTTPPPTSTAPSGVQFVRRGCGSFELGVQCVWIPRAVRRVLERFFHGRHGSLSYLQSFPSLEALSTSSSLCASACGLQRLRQPKTPVAVQCWIRPPLFAAPLNIFCSSLNIFLQFIVKIHGAGRAAPFPVASSEARTASSPCHVKLRPPLPAPGVQTPFGEERGPRRVHPGGFTCSSVTTGRPVPDSWLQISQAKRCVRCFG